MREMKDGGVERIGLIPQSWDIIKTKYVATLYTGNSIKDEEKDNYSDSTDAIPYIATKDIEQGCNSVNYNNGLYVKEIDLTFARAYPESTLMCIEGGSAGRKKAIVDRTVCFVNKLCCFAAKSINPRYLYYCLNSPDYEDEFKQNISGLIGGVSKSTLANFFIPKPSTDDQRIIADYLDSKCSKIDEIIAKQEQIIEKLKAYKLSIITETVTKGLDPNVEMKDSGNEYIGKIPIHWRMCRLRNIGRPQNGISKGGDSFGFGTPFVSYGDIYKNYSLPETVVGLIDATEEEQRNYSVEKGDIFFTRTSETIEEVGFSCVCEKTIPMATFAGFVIRVRPFNNDIHTRFAKYYFRSNHHRRYLAQEMNLVTRASLGQDLLKSMPVLLPPDSEQEIIADYLDHKCGVIEKMISDKQKIIEKWSSYKKSLIYEVVTGKKEV